VTLARAIRYRDQTALKAETLLKKLFNGAIELFQSNRQLDILIVGAGTFPSYMPLVNILSQLFPSLKVIHFTLIEPVKKDTDFFEEHFLALSELHQLQVQFKIHNQGLEDFLKYATNNAAFDVIYFEHPETMALPILLAKLGMRNFNRVVSLRNMIPYLSNLFKPKTWVIASCMSYHELGQLKSLLNFGLRMKPRSFFSFNPLHFFYGGPYSSGLSGYVNRILPIPAIHAAIQRSHFYLCIFLFLSLIIYGMQSFYADSPVARVILIFLMYAQLFFHRPGRRGLAIKLFLLLAMVLVLS